MTTLPYQSDDDAAPCADCGRPRHAHKGPFQSIEGYCLGFATTPTGLKP